MKRYRIAREARKDLGAIWDYIAREGSAETASRFLWRLYDVFATLAANPGIGVSSSHIQAGARRFPVGNYLIYYQAEPGRVLISRVIHGKRRQKKAYRDPAG